MRARRLAARLALRRVWRDRRRTAILLAVITLPLMVAFCLAVLRSTSVLPEDVALSARMGQASTALVNDQLVSEHGLPSALHMGAEAVRELVDEQAPVAVEVSGPLPAGAGGQQAASFGWGLDLHASIHQGRYNIVEGRPAQSDGEVAVTVAVTERLGVTVGDEVILADTTAASVVGVLVDVTDTTVQHVVVTPLYAAELLSGFADADREQAVLPGQSGATVAWLTSDRVAPTADLDAAGWQVRSRDELASVYRDNLEVAGDQTRPWILGATALVLVELGLVLAAVYGLVARSNRRELAVLAAAGAAPTIRRAVITYQGVVVGAVATVLALPLGAGLAWLLRGEIAARNHQVWSHMRLDTLDLSVIAVLGIATPAIAAWIAARGVGTDVVAALRDMPVTEGTQSRHGRAPVALFTVGAVLVFAGAAGRVPGLVLLGALVGVVAAGLLARRLLPSLDGAGDHLPLLHRLGLRATTRSAGRAATLATVIASLTVLVGLILSGMAGMGRQAEATYVPVSPHGSVFVETTRAPQPDTLVSMAEALAAEDVVVLALAVPPPPAPDPASPPLTHWGDFRADDPRGLMPHGSPVAVIDPADIGAVLDRPPTPQELNALEQGHALTLDARLDDHGKAAVVAAPAHQPDSGTVEIEVVVAQDTSPYRQMPLIYVTSAGLDMLGGQTHPHHRYLYVPPSAHDITTAQEDRARAILTSDIGVGYFNLAVERGSQAAEQIRSTAAAAAFLLVLVAATLAFVTVTLATQELRPDLSALAAAGANRRFRSLLNASHAAQVTLLGVIIGIAITMAANPALLTALQVNWASTPWVSLTVAGAAAVIAALAAGYLSGARVTSLLRRVR